MTALRAFFREHSRLAFVLVVLAMSIRALVPSGYMVGGPAKVLTVQICADAQLGALTKQIVIPHTGDTSKGTSEHTGDEGHCAFSSLAMASLSGADGVLLARALLFILALGFASFQLPRVDRPAHLRPPLRGPPAYS